ncbi:MAG TPA: hypothetical protein VGM23_10980, partial [Armatimonadota bacterium]
ALSFYPDSGFVSYRDPAEDVTLTVHCAPFVGYHAYHAAQGPCDRIGLTPGSGHFMLALGAEPLLVTPDSGYALTTKLRSCLLIDDQGQYGGIGYPMSIPSKIDRGEEIQFARWDAATNTGRIRLNLAPAYPEDLGLTHYTRDFLLQPGKSIICRDHVVLDSPRKLSWLFQGKRENGLTLLEGLRGCFGDEPTLCITPLSSLALSAGIQQTPVVWSYASMSGFKPFDHLRYDALVPVTIAIVDFVLTWDGLGK